MYAAVSASELFLRNNGWVVWVVPRGVQDKEPTSGSRATAESREIADIEQDNEARIRHIVASRVGRVLRAGHPSRRVNRTTAWRTGPGEMQKSAHTPNPNLSPHPRLLSGDVSPTTLKYAYPVCTVVTEVQSFGIKGVQEHACLMKELHDTERMQRQFMDCVESAAFPEQGTDEMDRLLHMVVVGGGPTSRELSGELHDFLEGDLKSRYPEVAGGIHITRVEALSSLFDSTDSTFKESKMDILSQTVANEVKEKGVMLQMPGKSIVEVPAGWWCGRRATRDDRSRRIGQAAECVDQQVDIAVDDHLRMACADESIFAIGCTSSAYAPTAQVASRQDTCLVRRFQQLAKKDVLVAQLARLQQCAESEEVAKEKEALSRQLEQLKLRPFRYSHRAPWRTSARRRLSRTCRSLTETAYLTALFSLRNRTLVATNWVKTRVFGRGVSHFSELAAWRSLRPCSWPKDDNRLVDFSGSTWLCIGYFRGGTKNGILCCRAELCKTDEAFSVKGSMVIVLIL
ncbi:hypothetical protein FIBSPDRAFT_904989 [Athelia psychrophila]|uniref:NADH:ubiquinone reductase (non-electrogenic) n=1 Tax=Athelia psychrophila TaxID=1759441 RepID=A0A167U110_9AGAM|nr:hypothetical protein FIBSPDRAFT_904989 [Fibularhizoctonia sp. CBS 109695]